MWNVAKLVIVGLLVSCCVVAEAKQPKAPKSASPAATFDLEAAKLYEELGRWKEAEQFYIQAGRAGDANTKRESFDGLVRLSHHRSPDDQVFELRLANFYAAEGDWKVAEEHYVAAAKDAPKATQEEAFEGIKRCRKKLAFHSLVEDTDRYLGYIARVLGVCLLLLIAWRLKKVWSSVQVVPFEVSDESMGKQLAFWFSSALDGLRSVSRPLGAPGLPLADSIPLIILPGLSEEGVDLQDLEIGGAKLPIAEILKLFRRPRIRISGRWAAGGPTGTADASIARRSFLSYAAGERASASIPSMAGASQDQQLEQFAYDVLLKGIKAYES